jgi:hypothetical protein
VPGMPDPGRTKFELCQLPWAAHSGSPLEAALDDGWEPFAVTEGHAGALPLIWLKRLSSCLTAPPDPP